MILLVSILEFISACIKLYSGSLYFHGEDDPLWMDHYDNQALIYDGNLDSVPHFVFSLKYFELVLWAPILIEETSEEKVRERSNFISKTLCTTNTLFYAFMIVLQTLEIVYRGNDYIVCYLRIVGVINVIFSCGLLIYSINSLRRLVNKKNFSVQISSRETLMTVHTVVFAFLIFCKVGKVATLVA